MANNIVLDIITKCNTAGLKVAESHLKGLDAIAKTTGQSGANLAKIGGGATAAATGVGVLSKAMHGLKAACGWITAIIAAVWALKTAWDAIGEAITGNKAREEEMKKAEDERQKMAQAALERYKTTLQDIATYQKNNQANMKIEADQTKLLQTRWQNLYDIKKKTYQVGWSAEQQAIQARTDADVSLLEFYGDTEAASQRRLFGESELAVAGKRQALDLFDSETMQTYGRLKKDKMIEIQRLNRERASEGEEWEAKQRAYAKIQRSASLSDKQRNEQRKLFQQQEMEHNQKVAAFNVRKDEINERYRKLEQQRDLRSAERDTLELSLQRGIANSINAYTIDMERNGNLLGVDWTDEWRQEQTEVLGELVDRNEEAAELLRAIADNTANTYQVVSGNR